MSETPTSQNTAITERSLAHVWHPCTQMSDHAGGADAAIPLIPIRKAEGIWLEDHDGRRYIDAVSSWWTNIFGHRHPHIVSSLKDQLDTLDHVIFAGFTHEPAVQLAERLCKLAPKGLDRCFYVDNGSAAVEAALKMSFHYWRNVGKPQKTRYIALTGGYHGETLGALAVGHTGIYRDTYAPLLLKPIHVASPDCYERAPGTSWEDHTRRMFADMELALEHHAHEVCAVILEPLVQCAGGMRMYHPVYLSLLREACNRHGVHLIADEIAVGFGRTGMMFACEWAGISPDFMCLSKGLTGGTLPLACVLTGDAIYQAFYAEYRAGKAFLHSHSYTGNPLACRAALATLDVFAEQDWIARTRLLGQFLWSSTAPLRSHRYVADVRQQGLILAIELAKSTRNREPFPASDRRGLRAYRHALKSHKDFGVLLRPLGDVIYFMPPYVIEPREVEAMVKIAIEAIDVATHPEK
ncbi:adenosylmethionine-8-amino-7-oxononanoate aminotransferase [Panacagrimonas perspica]|uniref:Adenosylmethionine-8-amino-7-oxononanoate aminotransferase n=1 Tax=Panacagrimonas perspica TaxID=381431 RepID=A0A4R7PE22_9GAMM|nr:adenosylmethionine--8-amino-7-oxononanoate transaminase [Panacagrimonas perspica]TDU31530.1 adenosylmethionine-8-amino-7-oxononanoate aminotransferase [Panacagrimonas perspica]